MNSNIILLFNCVLLLCSQTLGSEPTHENQEVPKTFLYFSYGSNMKTERIHKNSPSAKQVAIGKITNHRLDFSGYSKNWHGSPSTIVPTKNAIAWGVIWEIDMNDMPNLDKQEGVDAGTYIVKNVSAQLPNGDVFYCRSYQLTRLPDEYIKPSKLPSERQPSPAYLNTIIGGAKEYNLPKYYMKFLKSFRHNNYQGPIEIPYV